MIHVPRGPWALCEAPSDCAAVPDQDSFVESTCPRCLRIVADAFGSIAEEMKQAGTSAVTSARALPSGAAKVEAFDRAVALLNGVSDCLLKQLAATCRLRDVLSGQQRRPD